MPVKIQRELAAELAFDFAAQDDATRVLAMILENDGGLFSGRDQGLNILRRGGVLGSFENPRDFGSTDGSHADPGTFREPANRLYARHPQDGRIEQTAIAL